MSEQQSVTDDSARCAVCGEPVNLDDPDSHVNVGCKWFICGDCAVEVARQVAQVVNVQTAKRKLQILRAEIWDEMPDAVGRFELPGELGKA